MNGHLRNILCVSSLALTLFCSGAMLATNTVKAKTNVVTKHTNIRRHKTSKIQSIFKKGQHDGTLSSRHFYRRLASNYDGAIPKYIATTFIDYHIKPYSYKYETGYIRGFNQTANIHRQGGSYNKQNPGFLMNHKRYSQALKLYSYYKRVPKAYYQGFRDSIYTASTDTGNSPIPKRYRHNLEYAKGYLLDGMRSVHSIAGMDLLYNENQYSWYRGNHGQVSMAALFSPHYRYLYHLYWQMIEYKEHYALTFGRSARYSRIFQKYHHFTKSDKEFFNYLADNITYSGLGFNDYDGTGTGGYLWKGTSFARNLVHKAPFHHNVYYTAWAIKVADGSLTKNSSFDGVIMGINNTHASRITATMFHHYIIEEYYTNPKHQNRRFIKSFRRHYIIQPIVKPHSIHGHKLDYTSGVSIYHAYNKHIKNSKVTYYIPTGKGPLGWIPDVNG